jgi:type VI secretion system protein ImpL
MGLYQGDSLTDAGNQAYQGELNSVFLPAIKSRLEQHLESGIGDPDFQYEVLKTYLMLGDPEHLDPEQLALWMGLDWRNTFSGAPDKQGQLNNHLQSMLALGYQPVTLDAEVIESARIGLSQVPLSQLIYGRTKRDYSVTDKNPFRVSDAVGAAGSKVFERSSGEGLQTGVSGLFTYSGYHDFFKKQVKNIARQTSEENWVLDPDRKKLTDPEVESLQQDMQDLYFADYVRSWRQLLNDLSVVSFRNVRHAAEVLEVLSGPVSPMRSLLIAVNRNTALDKSSGLLASVESKAGEAVSTKSRLARLLQSADENNAVPKLSNPAAIVSRQFEGLNGVVAAPEGGVAPIEQLVSMLSQLYGQMDAMSSGMGGDVLGMAQGRGGEAIRRVQTESARQPEPVKRWLKQIASNSRAVTMGGARSRLNDEWQSAVGPICRKAVQGRYPFHRDSTLEVTLADFGKLFAPGGLIDNFFNENLKSFVNSSGGKWRWKTVGNASLGIPDSVLRQFQRAELIKNTFFQAGGPGPSVSFGLKPVYLDANVQSFLLDLEGQKFKYRHGPARVQRAKWPADDSTSQVRVIFEDASGSRLTRSKEGPWAWFRLLDQAELESASSDRLRATFKVSGRTATWEISASSVVNPFKVQELQKFRCPGKL